MTFLSIKKCLGVNLDHIATIRELRHTPYPDLLDAARIAQDAGADSITLHLRQDRRHIQEKDVYLVRKNLSLPLNLEMAVTERMIDFALSVKPTYCCLLAEQANERTTNGGLNLEAISDGIKKTILQLTRAGIKTTIFIDPDPRQIELAKEVGAFGVELCTQAYAEAMEEKTVKQELKRIKRVAEQAALLGLQVNAGHALHYENVGAIIAIPQISELNIGHAIIARAVLVGLSQAVREMADLIHKN